MNDRRLKAASTWLKGLAEVTRHPNDQPVTAAKIATMATLLAQDYPAEAFTTQSLHAVANRVAWFPAYAEAIKHLGEWWAHRAPPSPAISGPVNEAERAETERQQLAVDWNDRAGIRQRLINCGGNETFVRMLAGLVARHAPQHIHIIPPQYWPDWLDDAA